MQDIQVFELFAPEARDVLRHINPKFKKIKIVKASIIYKALVSKDTEIAELLTNVGIKKTVSKTINLSDWINYASHEAYLNGAEFITKAHLTFAFILLIDIEKFYQSKKLLLSKAGLDVDLSDQSFVQDLTEVARKIEPKFIGREKEITKLIVNLSTQNEDKPTLLMGESGAGKTSMMIELARRINLGLVPVNLLGYRILRIKFGVLMNMLAFEKPSLQGDFFSRLFSDILANAKYKGKIILFLDDLRVGSNFFITFGPVNRKAGVTIVGAAQNELSEKFWENPINKTWNIINLEDQPDREYLDILKGHANILQITSNVTYAEGVYNKILDYYRINLTSDSMPGGGLKLLEQLAIYKRHRVHNYTDLSQDIKNLSSDNSNPDQNMQLEKKLIEMAMSPIEVTEDDVTEYLDSDGMIGSTKDTTLDTQKIINLEDKIKQEIIGQDVAISALARALRVSSLKLSNDSKPIGTFLFLGPTGVGKTETAIALAKYLYGTRDKHKRHPNNFYRIDLTEYSEKHTVSRLFGAPPGYVGYDDSSALTDFVLENPESILLFDEIDKAHPDVLNSLLHIMDEGEIRNNKGDIISFENVIIIMTSNHGAELINKKDIGFMNVESEWKSNVMDHLKTKLKPEFINRFDEIIIFDKLGYESVYKIAENHLADLKNKLSDINIEFKINKPAIDMLLTKSNTNEYGARDLKRVIKKEIMDPISKELLVRKNVETVSITKGNPVKISIK